MLDDIGTKAAPRSRLDPLPPSVLVQTSEGNYQALYLFPEPVPVAGLARVEALQDSLVIAGLCDPGAKGPATRNCRMPFGVNGKHSPPQPCALVEWRPDLRYTIEQITRGLALPALVPKAPRESVPVQAWETKTPEDQRETIDDLRSALAAVPSDDRETWVGVGHYLRPLPDLVGYTLFEEWSRKSENFDEDDLQRFWGFAPDRADYRAVFGLATGCGWINPRSAEGQFVRALAAFAAAPAPLPAGASLVPLAPALQVPVVPFVEVDLSDLARAESEPQLWWCESYMPAGHVTLLGGHGGAGKSTLALMLAVCIALGWPFMGLQTRRGRVLFFSAEDQGSMVRRRLRKICRETGADPIALAQSLHVLDATEAAPVLFTECGRRCEHAEFWPVSKC